MNKGDRALILGYGPGGYHNCFGQIGTATEMLGTTIVKLTVTPVDGTYEISNYYFLKDVFPINDMSPLEKVIYNI